MKAVNLIPADEQRGAGGAAGRTGGAAYILLGALAIGVLVLGAYVVMARSLNSKKSELAKVTAQATVTEARAAQLAAYTQFSGLRAARVSTVASLAQSRFDWAHAMRELGRTIPSDVWLTSVLGTVSPGLSAGAGGGAASTSSLRALVAAPAIEIVGCTTSQPAVANMMARMRLIDGVDRVTLASSQKQDVASSGGAAPSSSSSTGGGDCRNGSGRYPQFSLVVFYTPPVAAPAVGTTAAPATAPVSSTATPGAGTTGATGATSAAGTGK